MKIIVSDLDKTYLDTRFESLGAMLRIPFEGAEDKRNVRGAALLMRALYDSLSRTGDVNLTFLSASPPWIRDTIHTKFALDDLPVTALITKNLTRIVFSGRWQFIRNHTIYKLEHLFQLTRENPEATFICLGDDWEYDLLVYCLFRDAVSGPHGEALMAHVLSQMGISKKAIRQAAEWLKPVIPRQGRVRILLHRARYRDLHTLRLAGDVIAFDSYLQLLLELHQLALLDLPSLQRYFREIRQLWSDDEAWVEVVSSIRTGLLLHKDMDRVKSLLQQFDPVLVEAVERGLSTGRSETDVVAPTAKASIRRDLFSPGALNDSLSEVRVDGSLPAAMATRYSELLASLHRKPLFDVSVRRQG